MPHQKQIDFRSDYGVYIDYQQRINIIASRTLTITNSQSVLTISEQLVRVDLPAHELQRALIRLIEHLRRRIIKSVGD